MGGERAKQVVGWVVEGNEPPAKKAKAKPGRLPKEVLGVFKPKTRPQVQNDPKAAADELVNRAATIQAAYQTAVAAARKAVEDIAQTATPKLLHIAEQGLKDELRDLWTKHMFALDRIEDEMVCRGKGWDKSDEAVEWCQEVQQQVYACLDIEDPAEVPQPVIDPAFVLAVEKE